jgi:hypothetical protein
VENVPAVDPHQFHRHSNRQCFSYSRGDIVMRELLLAAAISGLILSVVLMVG